MLKELKDVAYPIVEAEMNKKPIDFISGEHDFQEQTAYKVQEKVVETKMEKHNEMIGGYKISMTTPETQALANTDEPAFGTLLTSNVLETPLTLSLTNLFSPLIETELLFHLLDDLSMNASEEEIIAKSRVSAGLEIPDSRFKNWFPNFELIDLISDNGFTGRVITSHEWIDPSTVDLTNVEMELFHEGERIASGTSSNVMGNPVSSVKWLVNKLASQNKQLKKGMTISSGTFISPLPLEKGTYEVRYSFIGSMQIEILD